ncbi:DnaJ C-terminal domain-containing protein [Streptomyces canarius]
MSTKDFIEKDYYNPRRPEGRRRAEIKKAYLKLAREFHPDANKGNAKAEERFKEISEANDVLGDPNKRKEYDEARALFGNGGFRPGPGAAGGSFNFDLGDLFGGAAQGGGFVADSVTSSGACSAPAVPRHAHQPRRGQDIESEVTLSFTEAIEGATVPLRMSSQAPCKACSGTGDKNGTPRVCPTCVGTGQVARGSGGGFSLTDPCPDCKGRGLMAEHPCPECEGQRARQVVPHDAGPHPGGSVTDGQRIRLRGKGAPGERGGPAGDLYAVVHVGEHPVFGRKGDTHRHRAGDVSRGRLSAARCGCRRSAACRYLKLPPGTPNGRTMRARGKGAVRKDGTRGDLRATVEVSVPTDLSGKGS